MSKAKLDNHFRLLLYLHNSLNPILHSMLNPIQHKGLSLILHKGLSLINSLPCLINILRIHHLTQDFKILINQFMPKKIWRAMPDNLHTTPMFLKDVLINVAFNMSFCKHLNYNHVLILLQICKCMKPLWEL